jgi:hypothetical protein
LPPRFFRQPHIPRRSRFHKNGPPDAVQFAILYLPEAPNRLFPEQTCFIAGSFVRQRTAAEIALDFRHGGPKLSSSKAYHARIAIMSCSSRNAEVSPAAPATLYALADDPRSRIARWIQRVYGGNARLEIARDRQCSSRWAIVVAGAGSVRSSRE